MTAIRRPRARSAACGVVLAAGALCTAASGTATATSVAAGAEPQTLGTGYATAIDVLPSAGVTATSGSTGDIAAALGFVQPVLEQVVTPLRSGLAGLPDAVTADLADAAGDDEVATSAVDASVDPPDGLTASCTDPGWNTQNCFALPSASSAGQVITLSTGPLAGWAAATGSGGFAGARLAGARLSAFGITLGRLGTLSSATRCTGNNRCTSTPSVDPTSLFGGRIALRTDAAGSLQVSVAHGAWTAPADVPAQTVDYRSRSLSVSPSGTRLMVAVPIRLHELRSVLGVGPLTDLSAHNDGSSIALDLYLGQESGTDNRSTALSIGFGIRAHIAISVLGLADETVTADDSPGGNLATLRLARTRAGPPPPPDASSSVNQTVAT